jgi:hypothetical protein
MAITSGSNNASPTIKRYRTKTTAKVEIAKLGIFI